MGDGAGRLLDVFTGHFADQGQRVVQALHSAIDRAWKALEVALAGDSLWERVAGRLSRREDHAFSLQVRSFLQAHPLTELTGNDDFRQRCLRELRQARGARVLTGGGIDPGALAGQAGLLARAEPQAILQAQWQALQGVAAELKRANCPGLAWLVEQRPQGGLPLLALAVRYFFRREVETNAELARGLTLTKLDDLTESQKAGFLSLGAALAQQGERLESLLADIQGQLQVLGTKVAEQAEQIQALTEAVRAALGRNRLTGSVLRPGDSLSIRSDTERQLVKGLLEQVRRLPPEQQDRSPTLLSDLGRLLAGTGRYADAQEALGRAVRVATDDRVKAEAHYNAYRVALEQRDWQAALDHLTGAVRLDFRRFAPFPVGKYQPQRILGAGGFGVAFLCQHKYLGALIVVKALLDDDLDRDLENVFGEARLLSQLDDPALVRLWDCGYVDPTSKGRPYLVMDYFEGQALDEYVRQHGPLSADDLKAIMRPVAQALQAAHAKGILHRDVKPANLLVRRDETCWRVKLIDFGLALKQSTLEHTVHSPGDGEKTVAGGSIAGTLDYAAPEQMGKLPGVGLGPHSDVYGFGRTCYYALLGIADADDRQKAKLPASWRKFLADCTAHPPHRVADFGVVLRRLAKLQGRRRPAVKRRTGAGGMTQPVGAAPAAAPVAEDHGGAADAVRALCPHCRRPLAVRQADAGGPLRCPACGGTFTLAPPPLRVPCPHCRRQLSLSPEHLNRTVKCQACAGTFTASRPG
jgi:tetratricopeptide (TPR) repeat protein